MAHAGDSASATSFASATWTDTASQGLVAATFTNEKQIRAYVAKLADDEAIAQAAFLFDYRNGIGASSTASDEALALAVFTYDYRNRSQNSFDVYDALN